MTRTPLALLAAATTVVVALLAPDVAPARPRWTGVYFDKSSIKGPGPVVLRGRFVESELAQVAVKHRLAIRRACVRGRSIKFKSEAFATPDRLMTTTISQDRSFVLKFSSQSMMRAAHVELVRCDNYSFDFSSSTVGVGMSFGSDRRPLAGTGRNEVTTAFVAATLVAGGMLMLFLTRRRRGRPMSGRGD